MVFPGWHTPGPHMLTTPKDSHETTPMGFLQVYLEFTILCVEVHI